MEGYDVTLPVFDRTGKEIDQGTLSKPDERNLGYSGITCEDIQAGFYQANKILTKNIPDEICKRLRTAANTAIYGWFHYELYSVSIFWSLSTIEMAVKQKYREANNIKTVKKTFRGLMDWTVDTGKISKNIKIVMQDIRKLYEFWFQFKEFPKISKEKGMIKSQETTVEDVENAWNSLTDKQKSEYLYSNNMILAKFIPKMRNDIAHPDYFERVSIPRSAIEAYWQVVEILRELWPEI